MADPRTFSNLRNILAKLYPDEASTRRVAHDAGLSATRISFSTTAINTWHTILTEAENVNKVNALLDVVLEEYGDNPALREACAAYRRAAQPKYGFPNDFKIQNDFKQGGPTYSGSQKTPAKRWLWGIPILLLIVVGLSYRAKFLNDVRTPATSIQPEATPAPTPTATLAPTSVPTLQAGATRINPKDGAVYAYVPAGEFLMGSTNEDEMAQDNEKPQHKVFVGAFWIMQTEVTNIQYKRCVDIGACTEPNNSQWNDPQYAEHPVTDVIWNQARIYAEWSGGRLPTEAEWEKACRGIDGDIYSWGNQEPSPELLNFFDSNLGNKTVVGSYPSGMYGLNDMSGNVWEWTRSLGKDYPYKVDDGREDLAAAGRRMLRGGSFFFNHLDVRCAARIDLDPDSRFQNIGFRVMSPGP